MAPDKNHIRLAQFYNSVASRNDIIKEILKDNAIDYQIPANLGLAQAKLDLEGCTALHIALKVNDYETFKKLIRYDADFTIKNGKDETVIHAAMNMPVKNSKTLLEMRSDLNNKFINEVLTAHVTYNNPKNPRNKSGISHFHAACMTNHTEAVVFFLKNRASVSETIDFYAPAMSGFTPLHCAARYSSSAAAKILLDNGACAHYNDANGLTPFHILIGQNMEIIDWINMGKRNQCSALMYELQQNNIIIEMMLKMYTDKKMTIDDTELSCLHVACTLSSTSLALQLLEKNAELDQPIRTDSPLWPGYTALHFAAHFNVSTVKLLISKGANMLAEDVNGVTPFDLCLLRYEAEVVQFLIDSQTDWRYIRFSDETFLSVFIQAMRNKRILRIYLSDLLKNINVSIPMDSPIWSGFTPLHLAVNFVGKYKEVDDMKNVLAIGESAGSLGNMYNCTIVQEQLYYDRIKLMLEAGADVTIQDSCGTTPLHLAFLLKRGDVVNLLLQHHKNTSVNPIDDKNLSHLSIACAAGDLGVVSKLLIQGFDVNRRMPFDYKYKRTYHEDAQPATFFLAAGSTPLHIAVAVRDTEMAKTLMTYGADLYATDEASMTPIHRILAHDFHFQVAEIGRVLLSRRGLRDRVTKFGLSHLHIACHVNNVGAVLRLLDLGADIRAKVRYESSTDDDSLSFLSSYANYTPLDFAVRDNCLEAFDVLLQRGMANPLRTIRCDNFESFLEKLNDMEMDEALGIVFGARRLHKACFRFDVDEVEELLKIGADPNSRIPEDFKTFAGCTPLHILLRPVNVCPVEKITTIAEWLIDHGADVTLTNAKGVSPLHAVYRLPALQIERKQFQNLLLNGHKDFTVNPADDDGISHFHFACLCDRVAMVERFLMEGVDVNQPVGLFSKLFGGLAPLHLAARSGSDKTVDLLLKYGANVHAQDCNGNTPLHYLVSRIDYSKSKNNAFISIIKSLIRAGARMNVKNLAGEVPFERIMSAKKATVDQILEILPESRCFVNIFNSINEQGYIATAIKGELKIKNIMNNPLFATVKNALVTNGFDEMNRTPIHNIVAVRKLKTPFKIYMKAIHAFVKMGIDIDHQNTIGETALHYAVKFQNGKAVVALLALGADINKANVNRFTAFSCSWSNFCAVEELAIPTGITRRILRELWKHVYKLQLANLLVSASNKKIEARTERRFALDTEVIQQCQVELERFESRKFNSTEITLHSFLFDTGAVTAYPHMLQQHRQAVDYLFQHRNFHLREEFPEFSGILQMQYGKALRRMDLVEPAKSGLDLLTKYVLPDLCGYHILKFLTNDDLKKLIVLEEEIMATPLKRRKIS